MSTRPEPRPGRSPQAPPAASVDAICPDPGVEVLGCAEAGTMAFLVRQRREADAAAAAELRGVAHWADLHRVDSFSGRAALDPELAADLACRDMADQVAGRATDREGREAELRLAGEGAFMVAEFAVCELAAALRMSEPAARAYVGQAVELRDRLPRCWAQVMAGAAPAWKARKVAEQTIALNDKAAAHVDGQVAPFLGRISLGRVLRIVDAAIIEHDPELARERAERAAERRGVWTDHLSDLQHEGQSGLSRISVTTDTPDALAFDKALDDVAGVLGALGDERPHQVRRASAVGWLADPQQTLDLQATADEVVKPSRAARVPVGGGPVLHIHLHVGAVAGAAGAAGAEAPVVDGPVAPAFGPVARVQGPGVHGPVSIEAVCRWLQGLTPSSLVKVTPVVDLDAEISADSYEIPRRLAEQVAHRDRCCGFPWCGRSGRFDIDHIEAYRFEGGPAGGPPPGQTSSSGVARLCRFHHRVKTHGTRDGTWHYGRQPDGSLLWTSPLGRRYRVDAQGTLALDRPLLPD